MRTTSGEIKNLQSSSIPGLGTSKFVVSSLTDFQQEVKTSPLSLKVVLSGSERYNANHRKFVVESGQYLIVNRQDELVIDVNTAETTNGVCIFPPEDLVLSTLDSMTASAGETLEGKSRKSELYFTQKTNRFEESETGKFLKKHLPSYCNLTKISSSALLDFYTGLAEVMAKDQLGVNGQLKQLKTLRRSAQEELYRRLSIARDYIHDNKTEKLQIDVLANISCLSKYHFLRSFKDLFGLSPYQYLMHLKLEQAQEYRAQGRSYAEVSELIGFSGPKNLKKALQKQAFSTT